MLSAPSPASEVSELKAASHRGRHGGPWTGGGWGRVALRNPWKLELGPPELWGVRFRLGSQKESVETVSQVPPWVRQP